MPTGLNAVALALAVPFQAELLPLPAVAVAFTSKKPLISPTAVIVALPPAPLIVAPGNSRKRQKTARRANHPSGLT
jgi:hypothetical protein